MWYVHYASVKLFRIKEGAMGMSPEFQGGVGSGGKIREPSVSIRGHPERLSEREEDKIRGASGAFPTVRG